MTTSIVARLVAAQPLSMADIAELRALAVAGRLHVRPFTPEAERRTRLDERDGLIRRYAAQRLTFLPPSVSAKTLACHLTAVAKAPPEHRPELDRIIELNAGRPLAWWQILNVLRKNRGR